MGEWVPSERARIGRGVTLGRGVKAGLLRLFDWGLLLEYRLR